MAEWPRAATAKHEPCVKWYVRTTTCSGVDQLSTQDIHIMSINSIEEGDIIHGVASCGNLYRVLQYGTHPVAGEVVLLRIEKIDVVPTAAIGKKFKAGDMIVRAITSLQLAHRAEDCPYE